jgi:hypothetical protein
MGDWAKSPIPNPQSKNHLYYFFIIRRRIKYFF